MAVLDFDPWFDYDAARPISADRLNAMMAALTAYSDAVAAGGVLLDQAEITANVGSITSTTGLAVPGLQIVVPPTERPIEIGFSLDSVSNNTANGGVVVSIRNLITQETFCHARLLNNPANFRISLNRSRIIDGSAEERTFQVYALVASGAATIYSDPASPSQVYAKAV